MFLEFFTANYYAVTDFLDQGGMVMYLIFILAVFLWILIIERLVYIYFYSEKNKKDLYQQWQGYRNHDDAVKIKHLYSFSYEQNLFTGFSLIKILVAVAPLLGLFGTVYGMMEIFDIISQEGTGDAKVMAGGISMATLPTLSGMAVAITGLFFQHKIKETINKRIVVFNEGLEKL